MNIEFPLVSKKQGTQEFEPQKIFNSLLIETDLNISDAKLITKKVVSCIVSMNLDFLSGPLIREITNVILLQHKFEKQRLQYTRIGFPYYDLKELLNKPYLYKHVQDIVQHVTTEYEAVKKLIEERE